MAAHLDPVRLDLLRRFAFKQRQQAFGDDQGHGLAGLGPHGDAFAPADDAMIGFDPDQNGAANGVEIIGVGVLDRKRFDPGDPVHLIPPPKGQTRYSF